MLHWEIFDEKRKAALMDLACNKAFKIGRGTQYRDYIDLYFLIKNGIDFQQLLQDSIKKFEGSFNTKLFFGQLTYLEDLEGVDDIELLNNKINKKEISDFFNDLISKQIISFISPQK